MTSPDGKRAAFIRNYNLWVRDTASGKETQLTKDGVKEYGYATDNAGWIHSDNPILLWSPDSKKIATFQQDERGTGDMYLVSTSVGHPRLDAWKYPLPGDPKIFMIERVVIDVDRARVVRLQMPAGSAPLVGLRRRRVQRTVRGCGVERRRKTTGISFQLPRSQRSSAAGCGHRVGQGARRSRREGCDVLRIGERRAQLAISARVERGDLVLRAR